MTDINWFKFEDKDYDFPFYNNNPNIPIWGWIVLLFVFIIGLILTASSKLPILIFNCMLFIVPLLYFLNWNYRAIFRMPSFRDVALAVALFVGYIIYALIISTLLKPFGIVGGGLVDVNSITIMSFVRLIFSLVGEELVKFIPFIFFLRLLYKYTDNRKLSVIISVALVMVMFGCLHAFNPIMLLFALCIQGIGSIFEFYGYIKTKNIIVSYITHLCTDMFILSIAFI